MKKGQELLYLIGRDLNFIEIIPCLHLLVCEFIIFLRLIKIMLLLFILVRFVFIYIFSNFIFESKMRFTDSIKPKMVGV